MRYVIPNASIPSDTSSTIETNELIRELQRLLDQKTRRILRKIAKATSRCKLMPHVMCASSLVFVALNYDSYLKVFQSMKRGTWFTQPLDLCHQAFYQRFRSVDVKCMEFLFRQLTKGLKSRCSKGNRRIGELAPFASEVFALDQSTLEQIKRKFFLRDRGNKNPEKSGIPGKISALLDLRTNLYEKILFHDDFRENEKVPARKMLEGIPPKSLLLADLGYFSFRWFDELTERDLYFVSRVREKTSFKTIQVLLETRIYRESLVYLGAYNDTKGAHPFRLVEVCVDGKWRRYMTNVLEHERLSVMNIIALYALRWEIETTFQVLKETLGLNTLRLCDQVGVQWQLWATLLIYQIIQNLRLEVAQNVKVEFPELSLHNVIKSVEAYRKEEVEKKEGLHLLEWMTKNAESLGLFKRPKRTLPIPEELYKSLEKLQSKLKPPEGRLKSRKPRYDSGNRNNKHSGAIVGMERRKRKRRRHSNNNKKKQESTRRT